MEKKPANIYEALVAFQSEVENPRFDAQVDYGKTKFRYATLASVLNTVRPLLAKNGLGVTQTLDGNSLVTTLYHISGENISSKVVFEQPNAWQAFGSALTYIKRYSLCALLGIAGEEDDDANLADNTGKQAQQTPKLPPIQPLKATTKAEGKKLTDAEVREIVAVLDSFNTIEEFKEWGKNHVELKSNDVIYTAMRMTSKRLMEVNNGNNGK